MNSANDHTHCPLCGSCGASRAQQHVSSSSQPVFPQDNVFPPIQSKPKTRRGRPPGKASAKKPKSGKKK